MEGGGREGRGKGRGGSVEVGGEGGEGEDFGIGRGMGDRGLGMGLDLRDEWMRDFVSGEGNAAVLQETSADEVAEGVVFLVEGEDGGGGDT